MRSSLLRTALSSAVVVGLVTMLLVGFAETVSAAGSEWDQIDSDDDRNCGIKVDRSLWCWGAADNDDDFFSGNNIGEPKQIGSAFAWVKVNVGAGHACAIQTNGSLWCWGSNDFGQLGDGTTTRREVPTQVGMSNGWVAVAAAGQRGSESRTCGIKETGTLWCWGGGDNAASSLLGLGSVRMAKEPRRVGKSVEWVALSASRSHTCAIHSKRTLWCWGSNEGGGLGDGTKSHRRVPVRIGMGENWSRVSAGFGYSCATKTAGTLWCWGSVQSPLGFVTSRDVTSPRQVGSANRWKRVMASHIHTCATTFAERLYCWDFSDSEHPGYGDSINSTTPRQVAASTGWKQLSLGDLHTCVLHEDQSLWCWGSNASGQLGAGLPLLEAKKPRQVETATNWAQVSIEFEHVCAVRTDHTLWCWGDNGSGQLGDGSRIDRSSPGQVGTSSNWESVEVNDETSVCAVKTDHTLWCWGGNASGQLGDGTTTDRLTPNQVGKASVWASVNTFGGHTCAVQTDGSLWCWGNNAYGQLGDGTTTDRKQPSRVGSANDWVVVAVGSFGHTCAIKTDHTMWCWGENEYGTLGNGTTEPSTTPIQVGVQDAWASITTPTPLSCAVKLDHTLWCWGADAGHFGDFFNIRTTPQQVGSTADWDSISTFVYGRCAIKTDSTLWCWSESDDPKRFGTSSGWTQLSVGQWATCAVKTDHTLWCWGSNNSGILGDGSVIYSDELRKVLG